MITEYDLTRTASASFSEDRLYRYILRRCFVGTVDGPPRKPLIFCMANPSHGDAFRLDLTLSRCCNWAQAWGYSDLIVVNCFAYRSPKPIDLLLVNDANGPENDDAIAGLPLGMTIAAWGNFPLMRHRVPDVIRLLNRPLMCLGTNDDSSPRHPLARGRNRIPDNVCPQPWAPPERKPS